MPFIIDRVQTEIEVVADSPAPVSAAAPVFPLSLTLREQLELARVLRPVVLDILRDHLRDLSASGALR